MIRFGLNSFLFCSEFTDASCPILNTFKQCGAEVAELSVFHPSAVTASRVKVALAENALNTPVICGAFIPGRDLRGDAEAVALATNYISGLIDFAVAVGADVVCGPMYSETGLAEGFSDTERAAQLEQISRELKPLCEKAESAGVVLAVEPLNRFETDCINTLGQARELIDRVSSPALKIHIDTFHMNIEEDDSAQAIRDSAGYIGHVHASASHRGLIGQDQVDWTGVLSALQEIGYDGNIVIESFSKENNVLAKATSIWRHLYESPEQMATEGLKFLKKEWRALSLSELSV